MSEPANAIKPKSAPNADQKVLEDYIRKAIETDFPTIKVKAIVSPSLQGKEDIVGIMQDEGDRAYTFLIQKSDPRPLLQRL